MTQPASAPGDPSPPSLSAIIPSRNRPESLRRAVESVLDQKGAQVEVIVVDDGSSPPVADALGELDGRVVVVRHETSRGPAAARNTGVVHASAPVVGFLDDDDVWLPGKVERCLDVLERESAVGAVAHRTATTARARPSAQVDVVSRPLRRFLLSQPPHLDGIVVRRDLHLQSPFDERFEACEDLDYLLRLAQVTDFAFLEDVLAVRPAAGPQSAISVERRVRARLLLRSVHTDLFDRDADAFHLVRLGHLNRRARRRVAAIGCFVRVARLRPRLGLAWRGLVLVVLPWSLQRRLLRGANDDAHDRG